ncbi:MAG TPA: TonB family protein [Candidatus Obscuribacterales bacterium]
MLPSSRSTLKTLKLASVLAASGGSFLGLAGSLLWADTSLPHIPCLLLTQPARAAGPAAIEQWLSYTIAGQKAYEQGRYREAARDFEIAVEQAQQCENFDVRLAGTLNNLAVVYVKRGRYLEAEKLLNRSLELSEKVYGSDHIRVADTLYNISLVASAQGSPLEAEPQRRRAIWIYQQLVCPEQPDPAVRLFCLAYSFYQQGNEKDAELLVNQVRPIYESLPGGEHPNLAACEQAQAVIDAKRGRHTEAEEHLKNAIGIYEKLGKPQAHALYTSLVSLGHLFYGQGKYAEAEPYFKEALSVFEDNPEAFYTSSVPELALLCHFSGSGSVTEMQYKRVSEQLPSFAGPATEDLSRFADAYISTLKKLEKHDDIATAGKRLRLLAGRSHDYVRTLERTISRKWQPEPSTRPYSIELSFSVDAQGRISYLQVYRSSGASRYDVAALDACEKAQPLPPVPPEFKPGRDILLQLSYSGR